MAVTSGESVGVANDDVVAIAVIRSRPFHYAIKRGQYLIVGLGLDVHAGMSSAAPATVWAYYFGVGKGICPVLLFYLLQVDF